MIEEQVDEVFVSPECDAMLAADEAEAVAELEDEVAQFLGQSIFELPLLDLAADAEELEVLSALQGLFGGSARRSGRTVGKLWLLPSASERSHAFPLIWFSRTLRLPIFRTDFLSRRSALPCTAARRPAPWQTSFARFDSWSTPRVK